MPVFSIILGFGTLLGLGWMAWQTSDKQVILRLDSGLWVLFGSLVAGRMFYVAINWVYYQSHPLEIYQFWLGGISGPGALTGVLLTLVCVALAKRQSLARLADSILPLELTLTLAAWLGCWQAGCAYGIETNAWWGMPAKDEWGRIALRAPVQLLGALMTVGVIALLDWRQRRPLYAGVAASFGLLALGAELLGFSFMRADPTLIWRGLRAEAWSGMGFMVVAVVSLLASFYYSRKRALSGLPK